MKTRKWILVATGVVVTVGLIVGAGVVDAGWFSSSTASAELVSVETETNAAEYQDYNFRSENINQILREYDALAEYQVLDFSSENINQRLREYDSSNKVDDGGFELAPENINQILREFEAVDNLQGQLESRKAHIELDYDPLQRQMKFNLPEGIN